MSDKKRTVRTDLNDGEWAKLKSRAALAGWTVEAWVSATLRAALKGAKP